MGKEGECASLRYLFRVVVMRIRVFAYGIRHRVRVMAARERVSRHRDGFLGTNTYDQLVVARICG